MGNAMMTLEMTTPKTYERVNELNGTVLTHHRATRESEMDDNNAQEGSPEKM